MISYSAPAGDSWSRSLPLSDWAYDGRIDDDGVARGGLGMLVDGVRGAGDFRPTHHKHRRLDGGSLRGKIDVEVETEERSTWVGWRNRTVVHDEHGLRRPGPVEIVLAFSGPRNFSAVYLHMNNKFTEGVQVFSVAKVWFGVDGENYGPEPLLAHYAPDLLYEQARDVVVRLRHRIASHLKLRLYFASDWMMISEISLDSGANEWLILYP